MRRRPSPLLLAISVAFAVASCGGHEPPPDISIDDSGWLVASCPGRPDACVSAVEMRCGGAYLVAAAPPGIAQTLIRPPQDRTYARQAAETGTLRARCVGHMMEEGR